MLAAHLDALALAPGSRIFVPLCGKAVDIPWLLSRGYRVTGVELSDIAVRELFDGMGVAPDISDRGAQACYAADGIEIFTGDLFGLDADRIGTVDAVYDRAALVALPAEMRARYAAHVAEVSRTAPQLVVTFEYDQAAMAGPPFSVSRRSCARSTAPGMTSRCWRTRRCPVASRGSSRRGKRPSCCAHPEPPDRPV